MSDPGFLDPITVLSDIGGISIDITKRVSEEYDTIISQNPIEDGSPSTDHATNLPVKSVLQGGFSDMRISNLLGPAITQESARGLAKTQFDKLLELKISRKTFKYMNGLHLFKDMLIKNLKYIKEKEGFSVMFEIELWNIRIIGSTEVKPSKLESTTDSLDRLKVVVQSPANIGSIAIAPDLTSLGVVS